jgi:hypothetical protein
MGRFAAAALTAAALAASEQGVAAAPAPRGILVTYVRSGGLIGIREELIVYRDGRVKAPDLRFRLSASRLGALRDALGRARFPTLRRTYGEPCCDKFGYSVSYAGRTVTAYDAAVIPQRLRRLLDLLRRLVP